MSDIILNYKQHPDSGQQAGSREQKKISRVLQIPTGTDWKELVPAHMEASPWGDGFFEDFDYKPRPGYGLLVLNYISAPDDMNFRAENSTSYDLTCNDVDKDIRNHPSFRMKWFYDLYQLCSTVDEAVAATPAWWSSAIAKVKADLGTTYIWAETQPSNPSGKFWNLVEFKTKDGKTSYQVAQPIITASKYCRSRKTAEAFLLNQTGLKAPGYTYQWAAQDTNWLAKPRGIHYDGTYHIAQNEYVYADAWDTDFYATL
jgi:hypothetical protein